MNLRPLFALLLASPALGQVPLTTQHVDLNLGYPGPTAQNPPGWNLTINNENANIVYKTQGMTGATDWATLQINPQAYVTRPSGSAFDFVGVPEGGKIWRLPQSQNAQLLYLGVSAYRVSSTSFPLTIGVDSYANTDPRIDQSANEAPWVKLRLTNVTGPGAFSVWQSGDSGPLVWMATSDGIGANDSLYLIDGGHIHYNWAFTQPGTYQVSLEPSAFFNGVLTAGTPQVVTFNVAPVPEPPSVLVIGLTAAAGWRLRRRFLRRRWYDFVFQSAYFGKHLVENIMRTLWAMIGLIGLATFAPAQTVLNSNHHTDIDIGYDAGWSLAIHDDVTDTEYNPATTRFYVGPASQTTRPASASFNFVGVAAGQSYYRLQQTQQPSMLYLGFGTDELPAGTFASYTETDPRVTGQGPAEWIRVSLKSVTGPGGGAAPGVFSAFDSGDPQPLVWMTTSDGIGANDAYFILPESDGHTNFAFSEPGVYEVTFQASADDGPGMTNLNASGLVTYTFDVSPVPEPAALLLGGGAAVGLAVRLWRKAVVA